MKTIFKYRVPVTDILSIKLPVDAQIRCIMVDPKDEFPYIYAEVETENKTEERVFEVFGTGHEIIYDMGIERIYLGSFTILNGNFIGHVYERLS